MKISHASCGRIDGPPCSVSQGLEAKRGGTEAELLLPVRFRHQPSTLTSLRNSRDGRHSRGLICLWWPMMKLPGFDHVDGIDPGRRPRYTGARKRNIGGRESPAAAFTASHLYFRRDPDQSHRDTKWGIATSGRRDSALRDAQAGPLWLMLTTTVSPFEVQSGDLRPSDAVQQWRQSGLSGTPRVCRVFWACVRGLRGSRTSACMSVLRARRMAPFAALRAGRVGPPGGRVIHNGSCYLSARLGQWCVGKESLVR